MKMMINAAIAREMNKSRSHNSQRNVRGGATTAGAADTGAATTAAVDEAPAACGESRNSP